MNVCVCLHIVMNAQMHDGSPASPVRARVLMHDPVLTVPVDEEG